MTTKTKEISKVKEPIRLRVKKLANGNQSLYLDFYSSGKREYEFLKLYLVPETSAANKEANRETLKLANAIKSKKIVELQNTAHGFSMVGTKSKAGLIQYVVNFAAKKQEQAGGVRRGTYQSYLALARHLRQYSGDKTTFKEVDKNYCMGFIDYLKTAKSQHDPQKNIISGTQAHYLQRLTTVLYAAVKEEIIAVNPFQNITSEERPKPASRKVRYLSIEEVRKLVDTPSAYPDTTNGFLFSCFTGLRFCDVRGLTWGKLRKDNLGKTFITFTQEKTKKWENLPVCGEAMKFLPERGDAKEDDRVYHLSANEYNRVLKTWAKAAGIDKNVTFHMARHTNATLLLSLEVPIETVSKLLGHADIKTTQIYAKVIDKSKRDAVDKLDGLMR